MKKVRIFYTIVDNFPPHRVDVIELFARCIASMGVELEWYMARDKPGYCGVEFFERQKTNLPTRLISDGFFAKVANKISYWLCDILALLKCLFKSLDLIQARDKYLAALVGLVVARIKGIKFVYWCSYPFPEHDLECVSIERSYKRYIYFLRGWFGKLVLYHVVMRLGDHVFVQTEQMKRDIAAYGVSLENMTPVPMGVPQRLIDWAASHPAEIVPGRVVYLGTMASVRHLHVLIDAFAAVRARYPSATLLMVGDGDHPQERAALEQQVVALGLVEAIRFTGFVSIEEAWSYAASGAVCVSPIYPSPILNCGSPTKLFEYMALGRPVVCNTHPDQTAVIGESGAGLCVGWGVQEFAGAMAWMLERPEEAEAMGAKGPAWVAAHRTYPILAEIVWRKYQELLGSTA